MWSGTEAPLVRDRRFDPERGRRERPVDVQRSRVRHGQASAPHEPEPAVGGACGTDAAERRASQPIRRVVEPVLNSPAASCGRVELVSVQTHQAAIHAQPDITLFVVDDGRHAVARQTVVVIHGDEASVGKAAQPAAPSDPDHTCAVLEDGVDGRVCAGVQTFGRSKRAKGTASLDEAKPSVIERDPEPPLPIGASQCDPLEPRPLGRIEPNQVGAVPSKQPIVESKPDATGRGRCDRRDRRQRILWRKPNLCHGAACQPPEAVIRADPECPRRHLDAVFARRVPGLRAATGPMRPGTGPGHSSFRPTPSSPCRIRWQPRTRRPRPA